MSVDELTQVMEREEPRRPRRALVVLLTLGLIGAVIAVFLVTQGDNDALAQLRIRDDRVSVKPTEADFERGTEGQALVAGDTVRTNRNGQAQIDYFEGSATSMDSDTTLVIGALLNEAGTRSISIDQTNGRLWHRVERLTSSEDRYEVRTPNAIASVKGTSFATVGLFAPRWFYLGFDGETIVQILKTGEQFSLLEDECVTISENGNARRCTEKELEMLMDEGMLSWLGGEGFEIGPASTATPSASPTGSPVEFRRGSTGGGGGGGAPAADPTAEPRGRKASINTPGPDEDEETDEPPIGQAPSHPPPSEDPDTPDPCDVEDPPEECDPPPSDAA